MLSCPRWTRRKEARPAELLAAALHLFVERGYAATRLEDVARAAGVSKGTLYLYYTGKEDLFKAVVRSGLVPVLELGERMVAEATGPSAQLLAELLRGWWERACNTPLGGLPKLIMAEAGNFPEIAAFYRREVVERGHGLIRAVLARGQARGEFRPMDLDHATHLVMAPLLLLQLWRHSFDACGGGVVDADAYIARHLDLLFNGLLVPAAAQGQAATLPPP